MFKALNPSFNAEIVEISVQLPIITSYYLLTHHYIPNGFLKVPKKYGVRLGR